MSSPGAVGWTNPAWNPLLHAAMTLKHPAWSRAPCTSGSPTAAALSFLRTISRRSAWGAASRGGAHEWRHERERAGARAAGRRSARRNEGRVGGGVTGQTHVAGGALFTAAGLGAATAAGWMHAPAWALVIGIAWGAIAGDLPDIDHPKARVSRSGVAFGLAGRLLGASRPIVGRVHPRPARNAPRPDTLARVDGGCGRRSPPPCMSRPPAAAGRTCLDDRATSPRFPTQART